MDEHKVRINGIYHDILPSQTSLGPEFNDWRFNILVDDKIGILDAIFEAGGFASGHYRPATFLFGDDSTPIAAGLFRRVVNLFNDSHIEDKLAERIATSIRDRLKKTDCA